MRCVKEEDNSDGEPHTRTDTAQGETGTPQSFGDQGSEAKKDAKQSLENQDGSKVLPFEFVALEACLEAASSSLESEVKHLLSGFRAHNTQSILLLLCGV